MSRFFPHSEYAEEQPYPHLTLNSHIAYRGFQTGALIGTLTGTARILLARRLTTTPPTSTSTIKLAPQTYRALLLNSVGRSAIITTAIMAPATAYHMYGREEIEWQDRSWRLLENKWQMEVDDFSLVGSVVGGGVVMQRMVAEMATRGKFVGIAGGAGVGSLIGTVAYMWWRYGVKGGKFEEGQ